MYIYAYIYIHIYIYIYIYTYVNTYWTQQVQWGFISFVLVITPDLIAGGGAGAVRGVDTGRDRPHASTLSPFQASDHAPKPAIHSNLLWTRCKLLWITSNLLWA